MILSNGKQKLKLEVLFSTSLILWWLIRSAAIFTVALTGTLFAGVFESKLSQKHTKEATACEVIILGATMIAAEESLGNIKMQLNAILVDASE